MTSGPLRIGLLWDLRFTDPYRHTGVGKHIIQVVTGLLEREEVRIRFLVARDQADLLQALSAYLEWPELSVEVLPVPFRLLKWWTARRRYLADLDILYSPMEIGLWEWDGPVVCTLHGFAAFQDCVVKPLRSVWGYRAERVYQRRLVRRAERSGSTLLAVSHALADETVRRFDFPDDRIRVVGNGVEKAFLKAPLPGRPSGSAPWVQVGGINAYDGARAFAALLPELERRGERLVVVGDRHEEPWKSRLEASGVVEWKGFLSGEELRQSVRETKGLLMLPEAESFGILGLEALALGVPVIATRVGGVEEALGGCARYVDSADPDEIMTAMEEVEALSDVEYGNLQERGREHAEGFGWDRVVDRVVKELLEIGRSGK